MYFLRCLPHLDAAATGPETVAEHDVFSGATADFRRAPIAASKASSIVVPTDRDVRMVPAFPLIKPPL